MLSFTVTCTRSDYYHAILWRSLRRWDTWLVPACGVIFIVWIWKGGDQLISSITQAVSVVIAVTFTLLSMPYYSARSVSKRIDFDLPTTWTISGDEVIIEGANSRSNIRWILIESVADTATCFLFRFTSAGFLVVPKRQLDADQTVLLRQILRDRQKLA